MDWAAFRTGLELFNEARYYEAHEVLEDVWRQALSPQRDLVQGLVQIAVGLHHHSTGNLAGARSVTARGLRNLGTDPGECLGIDLNELRRAVSRWQDAVAMGAPAPAVTMVSIPVAALAAGVSAGRGARISAQVDQRSQPAASGKSAGLAEHRTVPLLDLKRQYREIRDEVMSAIERVCESQHFVLGAEVESLEHEISAATGAAETIGCASGTDALWLVIAAAGAGPGDEVLTSPFSFIASATAIVRAGARPVFADIDPATFNLCPTAAEHYLTRGISRRPRAVLPVHLYGQCSDMDAFARLGREHGTAVLEDAAQALGANWKGRAAGSLGDAAGFSFYPTKNLSAYGDAGCVTTSDAKLGGRMRRLRNHGMRERYYHDEIGWNSRLDAIQAAVLRVKLKRLPAWNQARRERAAVYDRLFAASGLTARAGTATSPSAPLVLPQSRAEAHHIYHQYVVRAERRDDLRAFLSERGVATEIYYPVPIHLQKCFAYLGHRDGDFPEAERAAREVLALPVFPELTEDEQRYVVESIAAFYS
jgi:dTDP-4-amino-4,6-dideoxygalactose transaminase/predicted metal-dependent hydrolase